MNLLVWWLINNKIMIRLNYSYEIDLMDCGLMNSHSNLTEQQQWIRNQNGRIIYYFKFVINIHLFEIALIRSQKHLHHEWSVHFNSITPELMISSKLNASYLAFVTSRLGDTFCNKIEMLELSLKLLQTRMWFRIYGTLQLNSILIRS